MSEFDNWMEDNFECLITEDRYNHAGAYGVICLIYDISVQDKIIRLANDLSGGDEQSIIAFKEINELNDTHKVFYAGGSNFKESLDGCMKIIKAYYDTEVNK